MWQWLAPGISGFLGAAGGAVLTHILAPWLQRGRDRRAVAAAIEAEVRALVGMMKRRDYVAQFREMAKILPLLTFMWVEGAAAEG